jgi:hypothetical protein
MLSREEWTRGLYSPHAVKGPVWYRNGSITQTGTVQG